MSADLRIEAPTDAQLAFIASLCRDQGWTPPEAVYSKAEASQIIGAMKAATYRPEHYLAPNSPMYDDFGFDPDDDYADVPF